jgi:hypothetical protein
VTTRPTIGFGFAADSTAPYGAGAAAATVSGLTAPVANKGGVAGAQNALAICKELMGSVAANYFYNTTGVTQPAPGPSAVGWVNVQGNPNLRPETAKTVTAGVVLKSPFESPLFNRMNLSIDYYKIHIDDAIEFTSVDYVYQQCLSEPVDTAPSSIYCQAPQRTPLTGGQALMTTPAANLATISTSGVDVQLDWALLLADLKQGIPGRFNLRRLLPGYEVQCRERLAGGCRAIAVGGLSVGCGVEKMPGKFPAT